MNNEEMNLLEWIEQYDFDALTEEQKNVVRKELGEDDYKAMRKLHLLSSSQGLAKLETPVFEDRLDRIFAAGTISKAKGPALRTLFSYSVKWWQAAAIFTAMGFSFWWYYSKRSLPERVVEVVKRDTIYLEASNTFSKINATEVNANTSAVSIPSGKITRTILKNEYHGPRTLVRHAVDEASPDGLHITTLNEYGKVEENHSGHSISGDELVDTFDFERLR